MHDPRRSLLAIAALWAGATLASLAAPAWAVIPGLQGPLQALLQALPQILPFVAAGILSLFSVPAWRARLVRWGRGLRTPRGAGITLGSLGLAALVVLLLRGGDRSQTAAAAPPKGSASGPDWTTYRANLSRTGAASAAEKGPIAPPRVLWTFRDPQTQLADIASSPAIVGGRVYVGSAQASVFDSTGMIYCLDAATGRRIWQFQTPKQGFSSPAVVGGRVYVGEGLHVDEGCKLYCLDAATGRKLWAAPTRGHTESSPTVVNGRVITGAGDDGVYCLDARTGKRVWHAPAMHVDVSPAVSGGKVFVGTGYGKLRALALDAATGKILWETPCDLPVWGCPALAGRFVYFGIGNGDFVQSAANPRGGVWCLNTATGKAAWRRDLPDAVVNAVLCRDGRVLASCRDGKVYALDAATGKVLWSAPCGGPVVASPATDGTHVYVAGGGGQVLCLDAATGRPVWTLDLAAQTAPDVALMSSPALANGRIYLGTSKEKLFCLGR